MKRTSWFLASITAIALTACGGGRKNTPGTPESGAAGAPADTTGMAPAPAPTDTSMKSTGSDTGLKSDTAAKGKSKKTTSHDTTGYTKDSAR